jgi:2-haloacid dehalogenase
MPTPRAFLFDAYGTLFDVHSVVEAGRAITDDPQALSALWRQKRRVHGYGPHGQLRGLREVTQQALSLPSADWGCSRAPQATALMEAIVAGDLSDVGPALVDGRTAGHSSNGSPRMLEAAVRSMGRGHSPTCLGGRGARVKASPRVYGRDARLRSTAHEILFVSSNAWDIAGAAAFGYRTCWCNRLGVAMEELEVTPDHEVERLDQISERLGL